MHRSRTLAFAFVAMTLCLAIRGAAARAEIVPALGRDTRGLCAGPIELTLPAAPVSLSGTSDVSSSVPASFFEDFEGDWPKAGWDFVDNMDYADYWLGARACYPMEGAKAGWLHGGGSSGSALGCGYWYRSNLETWSRYGPFDLSEAESSVITFYLFGACEYDGDGDCTDDDYMFLAASAESEGRYRGHVYCGEWLYGDEPNGYYRVTFDLEDYVGEPEVWFAFGMITDYGSNARGFHIDNLELATTLRGPTETPTITPTPSTTPTPTNTPCPRLGFDPSTLHLAVGEEAWITLEVCDILNPIDFYVQVAWDPTVAEVLDTPDGAVEIGQVVRPNPVFENQWVEPGLLSYAGQSGEGTGVSCGVFGRIHVRAVGEGECSLTFPMSHFGNMEGGSMTVITNTCLLIVSEPTSTPTIDPLGSHHLALPVIRRDAPPTLTATATPTETPWPSSTLTAEPTPTRTATPTQSPTVTGEPTLPSEPTVTPTRTATDQPTVAPNPTPTTTPTPWSRR